MNWKNKLKSFFGTDYWDDRNWTDHNFFEDLDTNKILEKTTVLKGKCQCNLILKKGVHLFIEGELIGNIIGKGNNTVQISGKVKGTIFCNKLRLKFPADISGNFFWAERLFIEDNVKLNASTFKVKELFWDISLEKFNDDEYLLSDKFQKWLSNI